MPRNSKAARGAFALAALLTATAVGFAIQGTGTTTITPEKPTVSHKFDVPPTSTTYKVTAWDKDAWFNPDDKVEEDDWEPIPTGEDGDVVDTLTVNIDLFCSGGEVYGGEGGTGEECAEIYIEVEWNNGNGTSTSKVYRVCCPTKATNSTSMSTSTASN